MEGAVLIVVDVLGSSGEVKVVTLRVVSTRASTPLVLINSIVPMKLSATVREGGNDVTKFIAHDFIVQEQFNF